MDTSNAQNYEHVGFEGLFDFSFRKFITLGVVKVLYILLLALAGIVWLGGVISGFSQGAGAGLVAIIVMTLVAAVQVIAWRVVLELVVVIFRIGDNTARLAGPDGTGSKP